MSARDYIARLWDLRGAFRRTFLQADGKPTTDARVVLGELRRFCYGQRSTIKGVGKLDPYASIAAASRQEVYFRIMAMLNLDDSDIQQMEKNMEQYDAS